MVLEQGSCVRACGLTNGVRAKCFGHVGIQMVKERGK